MVALVLEEILPKFVSVVSIRVVRLNGHSLTPSVSIDKHKIL